MGTMNEAITFYVDSTRLWRWTVKAQNGEIIGAIKFGKRTEDECRDDATRLGQILSRWLGGSADHEPEWYTDSANEHRWRVWHNRDGHRELLGGSSEGFSSSANARKNAEVLGRALAAWIDAREATTP